jgi:uncharacterized transporter YbjL
MIWNLLASQPEIALFASLALGFFIGSFKLGPIQLGGVCGSLIVALVLGQSGARLSPDLKNIAFALFIFALGFTGGAQFFEVRAAAVCCRGCCSAGFGRAFR